MAELANIIWVFLWASMKFLVSAPLAFERGFTQVECMFILVAGGWTGVFVFFNVANRLMLSAKKRAAKKAAMLLEKGGEVKQGRKFTRVNKLIVKTKLRFGMIGLAILTPALLSIPIGSIVCAKFYQKKPGKMMTTLLLAVVFWAIVLTPTWYYVCEFLL